VNIINRIAEMQWKGRGMKCTEPNESFPLHWNSGTDSRNVSLEQ